MIKIWLVRIKIFFIELVIINYNFILVGWNGYKKLIEVIRNEGSIDYIIIRFKVV